MFIADIKVYIHCILYSIKFKYLSENATMILQYNIEYIYLNTNHNQLTIIK